MTRAARIREAFRGLSANGKRKVTYGQVYEYMGIDTSVEKTQVRNSCADFIERGELVRVPNKQGTFYFRETLPKFKAQLRQKIWKAIRYMEKFTPRDLIQITKAGESHVHKYLKFLEGLGLITRHGMDGQHQKWRITTAGRDRLETPFPWKEKKDRHRKTIDAGWDLIRTLAEKDLDNPSVRAQALADAELIIKGLGEADDGQRPRN